MQPPPEPSTNFNPEGSTNIAPEVLPGFMGKPEMSRETRYDPCFETIDAVVFIWGFAPTRQVMKNYPRGSNQTYVINCSPKLGWAFNKTLEGLVHQRRMF